LKILVVDDHPIFLEGLKNLLLARGMNVVGTAGSGHEALEKTSTLLPDIILMDIIMKPLSGLQTTRLIKSKFPDIKIIMLTASESEEDLFEAVKSGASGYLLKSLKADELYESIRQLQNSEVPISPKLAGKILAEFKKNRDGFHVNNSYENNKNVSNIDKLSEKQMEVLILAAKGLKYKDIADILGIKERTVKYYMAAILDKLHMENRNQAIKYIIQKGIVD
jgi:two-component system NarL family response regulator